MDSSSSTGGWPKLRHSDPVVIEEARYHFPPGGEPVRETTLVVREISGLDRSRTRVRRVRDVGDTGRGVDVSASERVWTLPGSHHDAARRLAAEFRVALGDPVLWRSYPHATTVDEMREAIIDHMG